MEILSTVVGQIPVFLATLALVIAAFFKAGKEKGSILFLVGAAGLLLLSIASPLIYSVVMPTVIERLEPDDITTLYVAIGALSSILHAAMVGLLAAGTFARRPAPTPPPIADPYSRTTSALPT